MFAVATFALPFPPSPVWAGGVDDFRVAAGSCDTDPQFEPWPTGESDYRKGPKKTIHSLGKVTDILNL